MLPWGSQQWIVWPQKNCEELAPPEMNFNERSILTWFKFPVFECKWICKRRNRDIFKSQAMNSGNVGKSKSQAENRSSDLENPKIKIHSDFPKLNYGSLMEISSDDDCIELTDSEIKSLLSHKSRAPPEASTSHTTPISSASHDHHIDLSSSQYASTKNMSETEFATRHITIRTTPSPTLIGPGNNNSNLATQCGGLSLKDGFDLLEP